MAEAIALNCPVIATRHGGALDIVREGENGYFFDVGDAQALAGLFLLAEPVAALFLDAFWLGKPVSALQWGGAALTLVAIYLGSVKRRRL